MVDRYGQPQGALAERDDPQMVRSFEHTAQADVEVAGGELVGNDVEPVGADDQGVFGVPGAPRRA